MAEHKWELEDEEFEKEHPIPADIWAPVLIICALVLILI